MRSKTPFAALWLLLSCLALPVLAQSLAMDQDQATRIALSLLNRLDQAQFQDATRDFTPEMRQSISPDRLRDIWQALPRQYGALQGRGRPSVQAQGELHVVQVPLVYAQTEFLARIAIDGQGRVAGLVIQPAPARPARAPTSQDHFLERELAIGNGAGALPGTLTLPRGNGPFPAVVLVHGSGPHDRDETTGQNRPFVDIARGLAVQGVAVYRYEKRTRAHPQEFADGDFGIDDETTRDAVAAVALLRAQPGIDPNRVFVLGHSQGGMLAPRIASRSGQVRGLVLFAAPSRPILDLLAEQNRRVLSQDGRLTPEESAFLADLDQRIARVRAGSEGPMPLNLPLGYWRSVEAVRPLEEARSANLPMLLLQGARDIQVVEADWARWRAAFANHPQVTMKLYPALNHLGIAGSGPGTMSEYLRAGHLDIQLLRDIGEWIKAH